MIGDVGWYNGNAGSTTHPSDEKLPNGFGLYDMTGNVWEWSGDFWDGSAYPSASLATDPYFQSGPNRLIRGGSWSDSALACRVAHRDSSTPTYFSGTLGFRLVRSIP